jgi:hypothetical protein
MSTRLRAMTFCIADSCAEAASLDLSRDEDEGDFEAGEQ